MPYGGTYTDQIFQKAGITKPTTTQVQLANMFSNYIDNGTYDFDRAVAEFRVQIGQLPRGEYGEPSYTGGLGSRFSDTSGGETGTDPTAGWSDTKLILMQYGGLSETEADAAIAENPITASKYAQQLLEDNGVGGGGSGGGGGSSGGSVRTQFPSESRLENASAAKIEQELAAIAAGTSRFQPFNGGFYDPQTGEFFDPSDVGVNRFNADTSRLNATTQQQLAAHQTGPMFQEGIRQFDQTLALDALGEERAGKTAAANAEIGFGNLGVDRAKFIQSILNQPSDTLARLYMQRGGTSPLAKIEMADLLNSFNKQATNISNSVTRFAPNPALKNAITPAPKPVTPMTPTITPTMPTTGPGSGNPNYLSPDGDPYSPEAQARWDQGIDEGSIVLADPALTPSNYSYDPNGGMDRSDEYNFEIRDGNLVAVPMARGGYTTESRFIVGDQRSGKPTGHEELVVNPTNAPIQVVANKDLPDVSRFYGGSPKKDIKRNKKTEDDDIIWRLAAALDELRAPRTRNGVAVGAVDYDSGNRAVMDNDYNNALWRRDDRSLSNYENALAEAYPEEYGNLRRYDEGTGSFGDTRLKTLDAKPTGGFLNSLREALSDLPGQAEGISDRLNFTKEDVPALTGESMNWMPVGSASGSVDDVSRMFKKMTPAEKLKMAEEKGLSTEHIPLVDRLQAQYAKAREEVISAVKAQDKANPGENYDKIKVARQKAKELSDMLDEEMAKTRKQGQTVTEAMMDDYSNTLKQYKLISKHADNVVERQTGGMYSTYAEANAQFENLLSMDARKMGERQLAEYQTLSKLMQHKTIKALNQLDDQLNTVGQQMGQMRGGREGVTNIEPGRDTADSIRRALDPEDEINRYSSGTSRLKRYADGTLFPTYNDTHSLFPTGDVTQQQLVDMSRLGTGPGGTSVLSGQMPDRFRIPGLQTPTAMQFSSLSGAERENLRPRLAAEFNSTLEDLMFDIEQRYSTGPSRMAKFRG